MTLAARLLTHPNIAVFQWIDVGVTFEGQLLDTGGSQGWVINWLVPAQPPFTRFPFGWAVEPD